MVVLSLASWNASRSDVATRASPPRSSSAADRRREKVVRLVPGSLPADDPARRDEPGQQIELLEELRVELTARLVALERCMSVRRHVEGVPADDHGAGTLALPEADEHVAEAGESVPWRAVCPPDRARESVVGAVGERVAVDDEERLRAHVGTLVLAVSTEPDAAARAQGASTRQRAKRASSVVRGGPRARVSPDCANGRRR